MPLVTGPDEPQETPAQRVNRVIVEPLRTHQSLAVLALAAGLASTAPDPFGAIAAALLILAAGSRK